jgi:hypothetical protein
LYFPVILGNHSGQSLPCPWRRETCPSGQAGHYQENRMKKKVCTLLKGIVFGTVIALSLSGCYTMGKKGTDDVNVKSTKDGVSFEVLDKNNNVVAKGTTPTVVQLKTNGFNGEYTLQFKNTAGETKRQSVNGEFDVNMMYILGDVFLTGGLGFIIDAATGKMFKMPETITLQVSYNPRQNQERAFIIATLDEIRPELRQYLIPIGEPQAVK